MAKKLPEVPKFATPEEEDEFWQTHSPLDFEHEEMPPRKRKFRYPTMVSLTIRLDEGTLKSLHKVAENVGERPTALAREFIRRGIRARGKASRRRSAA